MLNIKHLPLVIRALASCNAYIVAIQGYIATHHTAHPKPLPTALAVTSTCTLRVQLVDSLMLAFNCDLRKALCN